MTTTHTHSIPYNDPGEKYRANDVLAACPICSKGFWQRDYLVNGRPSPETCSPAHGQELRAKRAEKPDGLTPRQVLMRELMREGLSNAEISERLGITLGSAQNLATVIRKLTLPEGRD